MNIGPKGTSQTTKVANPRISRTVHPSPIRSTSRRPHTARSPLQIDSIAKFDVIIPAPKLKSGNPA